MADETKRFVSQRRLAEIEKAEAQQSLGENLKSGFENSALSAITRLVDEEGGALTEEQPLVDDGTVLGSIKDSANAISLIPRVLFGQRAGEEEDFSAQHEELTTGIPSQYHESIIGAPNAAAASRARMRIMADIDRSRKAGQQQGLTPALANVAGGVVDIDLPLIAFTGGAYKAARVAQRAAQLAKTARLSDSAASTAARVAVGASGGAQAGLIVGLGEATYRETSDWTTVAESALQAMVLGGALNTILKGDVRIGVKATQDELHARIARNDSTLYDNPMPNPASADSLVREDNLAPSVTPEDATVAAPGLRATRAPEEAQTAPSGDPEAPAVEALPGATVTPVEGVGQEIKDISLMADNWRAESSWQANKVAADDEFWSKVAQNGLFNVTTRDWRTMYQSESSAMNFMLGNVFESPNGLGRGRWTAATGLEIFHRQIAQEFVEPLSLSTKSWARRNKQTNALNLPTEAATRQFNREVMLEMNERLLGRKNSSGDVDVVKAADALDAAGKRSLEIGKGPGGGRAVDGFENIPEQSGYSPYKWDGFSVKRLEASGVVTRSNILEAMSKAYRTAGIRAEDSDIISKAVIDRAEAGVDGVDTNLLGILSSDGREWLNTALEDSGMSTAQREGLMRRLTGVVEERGREGFTKHRNNIDLNQVIETSDGSDVRIVDLMNNDLHGTWQNYARRVSGSSALARVGINNRAKREQFIQAIQAQQRALGEDVVDADRMRAMLSHFDGTAIKGFSQFGGGKLTDGVAPMASLAKRMTNLSLLGKLGLAQGAETGVGMATVGLKNWVRRGPMALVDKELRDSNSTLLKDLSYMTGDLGEDHRLFAQHLDLDDVSKSNGYPVIDIVQKHSKSASYVQGYLSGFNHVRGAQQRIVSAGITDKLFRTIRDSAVAGKDLDPKFVRRAREDLGIFEDDLSKLQGLVADGTIEFSERGFVNRVHADRWDPTLADNFGAAIVRNMNQVVQKSMAGEQDTWMSTTMGSLMTHLITFPLQAVQKQAMRGLRHSDPETTSAVLMGLSTAAVAIMVRDAVDGRERSAGEIARAAIGYSNFTGWVPLLADPALSMVGLEDYRFNQFGPYAEPFDPPVLDYLNRTSRVAGAVVDTVTGDADRHDRDALRALPFANLYGVSRMLDIATD